MDVVLRDRATRMAKLIQHRRSTEMRHAFFLSNDVKQAGSFTSRTVEKDMTNVPDGVVPTSMNRPKRIAKRLRQIYPRHPLSMCQLVVAHLYFHKDWHALEQAVKSGIQGAPPLEKLLGSEAFHNRTSQQRAILCKELAGIDPDADGVAPKMPSNGGGVITHDVLAQHALAMNDLTPLRAKQASIRFDRRLTLEVLAELLPTASRLAPKREYETLIPPADAETIRSLPGKIAAWWRTNVPHQEAVAQVWQEMELDPDNRVALLRAGAYWSSLCLHYAGTISWTLVMGVTYLFAARYASLSLQDGESLWELFDIAENNELTADVQAQARRAIDDLVLESTADFMELLARDDLPDVFRKQPAGFVMNAEKTLKIFENPGSREGTWSS